MKEAARRHSDHENTGTRSRAGDPAELSEPVTSAADGRRGIQRGGAGVWTFLLAIVTAGALAHVAVRFEGLEVAYALGRERKVGADLEEQRRRLQIEIGMLKDPNRVVTIARDQLNMGPPTPDAIRRLGTGALFVRAKRAADDAAKPGLGARRPPDRRHAPGASSASATPADGSTVRSPDPDHDHDHDHDRMAGPR